jgi:hypothetical protein
MELKELVGGIVRHVLTLAGGALTANGALDPTQAETLVGAAMAIFGVAWSVWAKRQAAKPEEVKE